ncbi:MAG: InlB B-repeat-containing protein [Clostridia bacterium]|nr:InlB B-repeat-containing protein [Clostridia bacterium]
MKKLIAVLLAVLMLFSVISIIAAAEDEETVTYLVVFKDHDGTVLSEQTVESGKYPTQPTPPTRPQDEDGTTYVFTGWYSSADHQTYKAGTVPVVKEDVTYTATYQASAAEEVGTTLLSFFASIFSRTSRIFEQITKIFEDLKAQLDKLF